MQLDHLFRTHIKNTNKLTMAKPKIIKQHFLVIAF